MRFDSNSFRSERDRHNSPQPGMPASILVVDADDDTRAFYREWFARYGCEVVEAPDGRDALTKALVRPPALVLTETNLPFVDGYALCEILRRDPATRHVPILVITAESRPREIERARRAGADSVLVKPTMADEMLSETRRLVAVAEQMGTDAASARANAMSQRDHAPGPRKRLSKAIARFATTTPSQTPPPLVCPSCDMTLTYKHSYIGGVSVRHPEQWDHYECLSCGPFQYRHRTRKLRRLA